MQIGKHSSKLVDLRKAVRQGTLTTDGLLPIEGPLLLNEAHRSGLQIVDVFSKAGVVLSPGIPGLKYELHADAFKSIQATEHSQGVIATVRPRSFRLEDLLSPSPALAVVLCGLQDPGNVGTILRISEAFGATGCIALERTASFHNSKVVRASAGSIFRLPHVEGIELVEAVQMLRSCGLAVVGSSPSPGTALEEWDWRKPTAVMVGNEGRGLNDDELAVCDTVLRIPHRDVVESLNSAVATAVMLYEAFRQRR